MKTVLVTNIPAPYRESVHSLVSESGAVDYKVIYCSALEPNREWKFKLGCYNRSFINTKPYELFGRYFYLDISIIGELRSFRPDVVIISGFSVPFLLTFLWGMLNRKRIIFFSDATPDSESNLSFLHKSLRKLIFKRCDAFLGASLKTKALYDKYTSCDNSFYQSHLCADNELFLKSNLEFGEREFDIILCGQMVPRKMYEFSLDVIAGVLKNKPNLKVKILGSGILKNKILARLNDMKVAYSYPGFVDQAQLPSHYGSAKIFLFPSLSDPWGVVANEACASGTPVISCEAVGAVGELLIDDFNSFVLDLDVNLWVEKVILLLENESIWKCMSENAVLKAKEYNYSDAAKGILNAIGSVV